VLEFLETVTYLSELNDHGTPWSFLATANITHAHYLLFLKYVMVAKWWVLPGMNFTLFDMKPNKQLNKLKQPISGCRFFDSLEILLFGIPSCRTIQSETLDTVSSFVVTTYSSVSFPKVLTFLFICALSFRVILGIFLFVG